MIHWFCIACLQSSVNSDDSVSTWASETSSVTDQKSRAKTRLLKKKIKDLEQKLIEKDEMVAQKQHEIEVKEKVIGERDDVVTRLEKMDTHEHLSLKEEVIKGRDQAIQVLWYFFGDPK